MNGINPMQLFSMIRNANNPNSMVDMLRGQCGNNPVLNNTLNMVSKGDTSGIEKLARNLCKTKGIDVDQAISQIRNQFGMF